MERQHWTPPLLFQHTAPSLGGQALSVERDFQIQCLSRGSLGKASQAPSLLTHTHTKVQKPTAMLLGGRGSQHKDITATYVPARTRKDKAGREVGQPQRNNLGGGCWPVRWMPSSSAAGAAWQREGRGWQPLRRSVPITSTRAWARRGRAGPAACAAPRPSTGPPRSGWPRAGCPGSGASHRPSSSSPAPRALGTERP